MWRFKLKWWIRGRWFLAKKHVYCRFFHRRRRCYPEVWDRGINGPWHCDKCVSCGAALDYLVELLEVEKKEKRDENDLRS